MSELRCEHCGYGDPHTHDCPTRADHGISPAQLRAGVDINAKCINQHSDALSKLREKVEALEERVNHDADKHNRLCDVVADQMHRLDAAMKRIDELDQRIKSFEDERLARQQWLKDNR